MICAKNCKKTPDYGGIPWSDAFHMVIFFTRESNAEPKGLKIQQLFRVSTQDGLQFLGLQRQGPQALEGRLLVVPGAVCSAWKSVTAICSGEIGLTPGFLPWGFQVRRYRTGQREEGDSFT